VSGDPRPIATGSQTVGPFFHFGLAIHPQWGTLGAEEARGERLRLHVRVLDGDEAPVPDALVEIWQADADGRYPPRTPDGPPPPFWGFGRLPTNAEGDCVFETIRPGRTEPAAPRTSTSACSCAASCDTSTRVCTSQAIPISPSTRCSHSCPRIAARRSWPHLIRPARPTGTSTSGCRAKERPSFSTYDGQRMRSRLIDGLTTTDALADVFSDPSFIESMLAFEAALARVEARLGIIPDRAARAIVHAAGESARFDAAAIARATRQSATPGVPLVAALTERVRAIDEWSARFVHVGATSQDVVDTALVLTISRAQSLLDADHVRLATTLRALSEAHASSVMMGRTLLQPAPP
jgi:hypothetical protein